QSVAYDAQPVDQHSRLDLAVLRTVLIVDDPDEFLRLVADDRLVGNLHGLELSASDQTQAREQPGRQPEVRIRQLGARNHRSGRRVELIVDEIHRAFAWKAFLVADADPHRIAMLARARALSRLREMGVLEVRAFV